MRDKRRDQAAHSGPNRFLRFAFLLLLPVMLSGLHAADFTLPGSITNLTASPGPAAGEIRLDWIAMGDDYDAGNITGGRFAVNYFPFVAAFDMTQAQINVSTSMVVSTQQTYIIRGLSPGVTYYFGLWVRDEVPANWSGVSNTASAWAQLGAVAPPAAPSGFSGVVLSSDSVHFSWTDNSVNEQGFRLKDFTAGVTAVLAADTTDFVQAGFTPNTSYYRTLESFNSAGAASTGPVTFYTLSAPSSGTYVSARSSWSVNIAWQANNNPALTRWGVERSTDNFSTYQVLKSSSDVYTARTYFDSALADLTTYYYRVNSFNA